MSSFWDAHRWLRVAFSALAVLVGLLLMWVSGQWTLSGIQRVLRLPDAGGHGFEFLTLGFLGTGAFFLAAGTAAVNICALAITNLFERPISELSSRAQKVTRTAFVTATIITLLAVAVGMLLLFNLLLIRSLLPWLLAK